MTMGRHEQEIFSEQTVGDQVDDLHAARHQSQSARKRPFAPGSRLGYPSHRPDNGLNHVTAPLCGILGGAVARLRESLNNPSQSLMIP